MVLHALDDISGTLPGHVLGKWLDEKQKEVDV
jgi:hypothetical protein